LELGKRSLSTNQYGISVTSHNISNASTPGYSRQRLNVTPSASEKMSFGFLGMGVDIQSVQRLREGYIDQQVYTVNQNMGRAAQRESILRLTESALHEPSDTGLAAMMAKFFASFSELSLHPEESANRNAVLQRAGLMAGGFNRVMDSMDTLKNDVLKEAEAKVDRINALIKGISDLDKIIMTNTTDGSAPNDVMDQRDNQLAELSKLVDIRVSGDANGSSAVSVGGAMIISGGNPLTLTTSMNGDQLQINIKGVTTPLKVSGGELNALVTLHNSTFKSYGDTMNELASSIITAVNTIHRTGYGIGDPPPTGNDFFTGTDARSIALDPAVVNNVNNIAASSDGAPGNNDIAIALANVQNDTIVAATATASQFYGSFVSNIGSDIQSIATENESAELVLEQLEAQQNSVSGVSLDEEMTRLIQYQHGFDAAARIVSTVNDMFETIIRM
jgi:flagellar hook-associated protein 1 FlgK